jgi:hypothetical protein
MSHPYVPLPMRFHYPQDARCQLERARDYIRDRFGAEPRGLWPSEGSVSDEALAIAAETGFRWAATDNGVLSRTLGRTAGLEETYRPYVWRQNGREMRMIFRDHYLSDLIGFVYQRLGPAEAAADFLNRIRDNARGILSSGRDALVPIILDGENAWEHYPENGRPFLRELYRSISADPSIQALTMTEALDQVEPQPLSHIFPGSWINANFDVWIGAEEDNVAWDYLLRARQTYDRATLPGAAPLTEREKTLAYEELLIAEGSDWCWWYGPEHSSDFRVEFDELYRSHLANVYRALRLPPPEELSRPILKTSAAEEHTPPTGPIKATIDGEVSSYFEWMGAGVYRVDARSGAMHGKRHLIQQLYYGSDGQNVYIRLDFDQASIADLAGVEAHITIQPCNEPDRGSFVSLSFQDKNVGIGDAKFANPAGGAAAQFAFHRIFEARIPLTAVAVGAGQSLRIQLSLWKQGLPLDSIPQEGWLEISTAEPTDWPL